MTEQKKMLQRLWDALVENQGSAMKMVSDRLEMIQRLQIYVNDTKQGSFPYTDLRIAFARNLEWGGRQRQTVHLHSFNLDQLWNLLMNNIVLYHLRSNQHTLAALLLFFLYALKHKSIY